jgi:hypothetical protein
MEISRDCNDFFSQIFTERKNVKRKVETMNVLRNQTEVYVYQSVPRYQSGDADT